MWTEKDNLLPHHDENKLIQEGQIYLSIVMNGGGLHVQSVQEEGSRGKREG